MRLAFKIGVGLVAIAAIALVIGWFSLPKLNDRQTTGEIALPSLQAPVRIVRDARAMPYIYAENLPDAFRAQGFVAGQDRLFQLEAAKRAATGRLSEVFGAGENDVILNLDRESRTIGFHRFAAQQAAVLSPESRAVITAYLQGLNGYIETRTNTHPLEFRLAGFTPEPWTEIDVLSVTFFLGWASSANFDAELTAHKLIQHIGAEMFDEISPVVINPDDAVAPDAERRAARDTGVRWSGRTETPSPWSAGGWQEQGYGGSNNWAVSGAKAGQPAAIVTNDPHLDSRALPGPWHPVGFILPDLRVVGVTTGLPGIVIGRNEHVAFGVTNAYADAVDVYVETRDPADSKRYLEGDLSLRFETFTEIIRVKDDAVAGGYRDVVLEVEATRRGPVISEPGTTDADTFLTLRWAAGEYMGPHLGLDTLMQAKSIEEALGAIDTIRTVSLNFVVGDVSGRIARRASGAAPIRLRGDGMSPFPIMDSVDNWAGPIPPQEMPGEIDPERGWTGTANHMTAPANYPYIYTTFASPDYRYRRMQELFAAPMVTAEAVWAAQYDTQNLFARDLAPIFAAALRQSTKEELIEIGDILADWDHNDSRDSIATTLFQDMVRHLARLTFEDELGADMASEFLSNWYVWQQRFDGMVQGGTSPWFDDVTTVEVEDLTALIHRAAGLTLDRLTAEYGPDRSAWRWGQVHQLRFRGPLRRDGIVGRLTGNRDVPMAGAGETLLRALYPYHAPFDPQWTASLRMTADLNDPEKVRAILPGGVVGRTFHPNLADQIVDWADEDMVSYWWFSDAAIAANTKSTLTLTAE